MKKIRYILFIVLVLSQSCVVYQKGSLSLDQAVNKGQVKLTGSDGQVYKFTSIEVEDSIYYGVGRKYLTKTQFTEQPGYKTEIDSTFASTILIKDTRKSKNRTVWLIIGMVPIAIYVVAITVFVVSYN